ncbi:MAG: glycoside hydrolase [Actinobacteria bacterium]|nr:glycoside hydrolase [Actinomycetota bacterium]MCA1720617.1 glycoside hydrolase [Actinomycetota bacterium]
MTLARPSRRVRLLTAAAAAALAALALPASATTPAAAAPPEPTYRNYPAPAGLANGAGEPSIGANWKTGAALFQSNTQTLRVTFDDAAQPPKATWEDRSDPLAVRSLDPILFTDSPLGRTYTSQLLLACSIGAYTDDDGGSYQRSEGCGEGTAVDHQTVGGGPYSKTLEPPHTYPHAFYYCAQYILSENCARSDDGGRTFGPGVPIYNTPVNPGATLLNCAGLSGHLRVAPDGTAYVPNFDCDGKASVTVSEDNGTTWQVRNVPSTTQDESDPSVAADADNTLYFGWQEGKKNAEGSRAFIGVSRDRGKTWTNIQDAGAALGIKNVQFPEVIAGSSGRAAYAFLGTPTAGDDQKGGQASQVPAKDVFPGVWHLYVSRTFDAGKTWRTVDVTPNDPVQRGCVWLSGGSSSCRNLLDFYDITVDKQGRVLVGWADGCLNACVTKPLGATEIYDDPAHKPDYRAKHGTITRQVGGLGLFAAQDATAAAPVSAPAGSSPQAPPAGRERAARSALAATGASSAAALLAGVLLLCGLLLRRRTARR